MRQQKRREKSGKKLASLFTKLRLIICTGLLKFAVCDAVYGANGYMVGQKSEATNAWP